MSTKIRVEVLTINSNLNSRQRALACILTGAFIFINIFGTHLPTFGANGQRTKLVVFLIADQFPYSYFLHYADKFRANGLRQLMDDGANFTACRYLGATNQTASNLATVVTGAYPWATGVVGNEWYDRRKQKSIRASAEENVAGGDAGTVSNSATLLCGTTIGDELKIATGGLSHVVTISTTRNDSSILAGKSSGQVFWWDFHSGSFCGENHNSNALPAWVKNFNEKHYSENFAGKTWQSDEHPFIANSFANKEQQPSTGAEKTFSHVINNGSTTSDESFYTQFLSTPWANQMLVDFAKEAITQESLGQRDTTDMLNISFPAFEIVGKNYGPYSQESQDLVWRFDEYLSELLQCLDAKVGLSNCLIVFTAGHGAMSSPQMIQLQGMEAGVIDAKTFQNQLNSALCSKLGKANWVDAFLPPNLYLNLNAIDHSNFHQPDVEKLAAKLGRSISGVAEIYTAFQFFMNQIPLGPQVDMVRKSYFWGRSGELYVIPKPGFVFSSENDGIVCGSPYSYDTQVPLIIYGNGIKAGTYAVTASPADIVPTVANILGICAPPFSEGCVLNDALNTAKTRIFKTGK